MSSGAAHTTAVVVGGGPAGATTALTLARRGIPVLVVERGDGQGDAPGESLAPSIMPLLDRLGLRAAFLATEPLACPANRSAWGDSALDVHDFIRDRHGSAWHIDRRRLEAMLRAAAVAAGATVRCRTRLTTFGREGGLWRLQLHGGRGPFEHTADILVDATGRAASAARRLGVRRLVIDRLVAAVAFLRPTGPPMADATTLIEAVPEGWWYSSLLPDGRLSVAYFTDPDLLRRLRLGANGWPALLAASTHTRARIAGHGFDVAERPRIVPAGSVRLAAAAGDGWLAVGDAAAAYDPLSSHGIGTALTAGLHAAEAIGATLAGDATALAAYAERFRRTFDAYLPLRLAYYRAEGRWPEQPFWRRRHDGGRSVTT